MQIKQWEDKNLSQFSYGILSDCEKKVILIDPSRNPQPYLTWALENGAEIVGIIETHPHADFISSHLELQQTTGATVYTHSLVGASYPHQAFDEGATIIMGKIKLTSIHTSASAFVLYTLSQCCCSFMAFILTDYLSLRLQ